MKVLIQGYGFPVHGGAFWASETCGARQLQGLV